MKNKQLLLLFILSICFTIYGCGSSEQCCCSQSSCNPMNNFQKKTSPFSLNSKPISQLAPIILYKTKNNYNNLVPITLSQNGDIMSYPSRYDLGSPQLFSYPIELKDGYLWDLRGVSMHSVFLDLSYEEYYNLPKDPSIEFLRKHIKHKNPFVFLAICDRSSIGEVSIESLNRYIEKGMPNAKILLKK